MGRPPTPSGRVVSIDPGLDDAAYRAVPALSYSTAKSIMRSPALFAWELEHGRPPKTDFDVGHAAHAQLLGSGAPVVVAVDDQGEPFGSWTPKARAVRDRIRADGGTPLLAEQAAAVDAMVAAVRSHPLAGKLFEPGRGVPEVSAFWTDEETGTAQKARFDWLIVDGDDGRPEIVDFKSTTDVRRRALVKTIDEYRYNWQDAHYTGGLAAHGVPDARFLFVFVEKTPPYLVRVVELDDDAWHTGARWMAAARRLYARCLAAGDWPAYPGRVEVLGLPHYSPRDPEDVLT